MALSFYAFGYESAPADGSQPKELKPVAVGEGFALGGVTGLVTRDAGGKFFFHPDEPLADNTATIEKGRAIEILDSSSLQAVMAVYRDDTPLHIKAWGMLTVFDKTNYAYINYVLPVTVAVSVETTAQAPKPAEEPKSDEVIPQDVLDKLRSGPNIDTKSIESFELQKPDGIYADRTGFVQLDKAGKYVFIPDGLGQNVEKEKFYLLKCQTLESVVEQFAGSISRIRYKVAGMTNEFEGEKYILLQRAARVYGYGNLSEF